MPSSHVWNKGSPLAKTPKLRTGLSVDLSKEQEFDQTLFFFFPLEVLDLAVLDLWTFISRDKSEVAG